MVANSRINPNFPIPGIDQSSKGFRDNFSNAKNEIEALQGKRIVLTGDVLASPTLIDSGGADIVIDCTVAVANVAAGGGNLNIQYNLNGVITGSDTFVYLPNSNSVGIGTATPLHALDVNGNAAVKNSLVVTSTAAQTSPYFQLSRAAAGEGSVVLTASNATVTANSVNSKPVIIQMNGVNIANFSGSGLSVGSNATTAAANTLYVESTGEDIAKFNGTTDFSDNGVRITTAKANSTAGIILEQRATNSVGGMRIDTDGNITLHSGESMDAQLSTSSVKMLINATGQIGIGTSMPLAQLDVVGGIRTTQYSESDGTVIPVAAAFVAVLLDSWPMARYRSARYTVQLTDTVTGNIDVSSVIIMHANGSPYFTVYANTNNAGSLGTLGAEVNGSMMELTINTPNTDVVVKLESHYITL